MARLCHPRVRVSVLHVLAGSTYWGALCNCNCTVNVALLIGLVALMPKARDVVEFSKSGPFFSMVGTFMVALAANGAVFRPGNPLGFTSAETISINGVQVGDRYLRPLEIYNQAQHGHTTIVSYVGHCCMMLANLAYERVKGSNDRSPEFEFFRHVRNASSHYNAFPFHQEEPRRPASWKNLYLDHSLKGRANPMYGKQCFGPTLGPADLIELLTDIEEKFTTCSDVT
jgi:hypothetical protein